MLHQNNLSIHSGLGYFGSLRVPCSWIELLGKEAPNPFLNYKFNLSLFQINAP